MVDGNVEESLYLVCMQVHCDDTVYTSYTKQIGYEFGSDTDTGLVFTVLACPTEIGDNGVDGTSRSTFGGIDHQQQFHKVVAVGEGALYEKDVTSADAFLIRNRKLPIGELRDLQLS